MIGNETRYHSPGDDLAALDPRSLQHMGDQALAVSSELVAGVPRASGQRIFMDLFGRSLVQLPLAVGLVLFCLLIGAFALLLWRRGAYGRALAAVAGALVAGGVLGWLSTIIIGLVRDGTYWRAHPELSFIAIYASALFAALAVMRTLGRNSTQEQLRAAWWLVFLLLGAALAAAAPGAIIYFLAPPLAVLLGIAASRWRPAAEPAGGVVAIILLYVTWGEMLALLEELFDPGPIWVVAPVGAMMIIPALIEAQPLFAGAARRVLLLGSAIIALIAWAVAMAAPA